MTDPTGTTYSSSVKYSTPADEWAALLGVAAQPSPARAIVQGRWQKEYFTSDAALAAFARLADTGAPVAVDLPADLDGVQAPADAAALETLRRRLGDLAQARKLAALQYNVARYLRELDAGRAENPAHVVSEARAALDTVASLSTAQQNGAVIATLGELIAGYWERVKEQRNAVPSGLRGLDDALNGGFQPRRMVMLLGAPGSGKTTLANQIAEHIADTGRPVVYLTTEDTPDTLLAKTIARIGGLNYGDVLQGRESERARINETLARIASRQSAQRLLYVEGSGALSLDELRALTRAHFARFDEAHGGGPGLLIVDYLQRWARSQRTAGGGNEELRVAVGRVADALRDVARELNCTVLALASQNRASGYSKGANGAASALTSAKESGDIEYTADVLMAIADDEKRKDTPLGHEARTLRIDKNRQGALTTLAMDWYPARQTWTEAGKEGAR